MSLMLNACTRCSGPISEAMRFCPSCGKRLVKRSRNFPLVVGGGAVALFAVALGLKSYLIPPQQQPIPASQHAEQPAAQELNDPQVVALREQLEQDPQNVEKLKILAGILGDKMRQDPQSASAVVFEAIDVLSRILALRPNDPAALVMMADVSFDQKAFTKAQDFYERYLKLEPENLGARARYASALTFLGEFDKSIAELNRVLSKDPKNFPAMAYLAITYAQRGEIPKAKEMGAAALNIAPSDEARARFSAFVATLDKDGASSSEKPASSSVKEPKAQSVIDAAPNAKGLDGFLARLRSNPIAGPKFVSHQEEKGELKLAFKEFPMSHMPPVAKEKFFGSLRKAAVETEIKQISKISFLDAANGQVMDQMTLESK